MKDKYLKLKDISHEKLNNIITKNNTIKKIKDHYKIDSINHDIDNLVLAENILNGNFPSNDDIKSYILALSYREVHDFFTGISKLIGKILNYEYFTEDQDLDIIGDILHLIHKLEYDYYCEKNIFDIFIDDEFMIDAYHCGIKFCVNLYTYIEYCLSNDIFHEELLDINNLLNVNNIIECLISMTKNEKCKEYLEDIK